MDKYTVREHAELCRRGDDLEGYLKDWWDIEPEDVTEDTRVVEVGRWGTGFDVADYWCLVGSRCSPLYCRTVPAGDECCTDSPEEFFSGVLDGLEGLDPEEAKAEQEERDEIIEALREAVSA